MSEDAPAFDVPDRPKRRFTATGSVEYEGETVFTLTPDEESNTPVDHLDQLVTAVLDEDRYVSGDWFDLPRPVYLVYDREESTAFRVVIRDGRVELHLLPDTAEAGLQGFYDQLVQASERGAWTVTCRVSAP